MGLFKPTWQSNDIEKARKVFLKKLTDEQLLLIAEETKHDCIKQEAVSRISSNDILIKKALGADYSMVQVAVSELGKRDQNILFQIGLSISDLRNHNFKNYGALREILPQYIIDQKILGQLCHAYAKCRAEFAFTNALFKLSDQEGMAFAVARFDFFPQLNLKDNKGYLLDRIKKHITDTLTDENHILTCIMNVLNVPWCKSYTILNDSDIYSVFLSNIHTPDILRTIISNENNIEHKYWNCDNFIKKVNDRLSELTA